MNNTIVRDYSPILVTGASGFIGARVVDALLRRGHQGVRCLVRPTSDLERLNAVVTAQKSSHVEILKGNLLNREDCRRAVHGCRVIYHLAASRAKSFAASFTNSVVTTRNLLDAVRVSESVVRFVNVSSFAVYSNFRMKRGALLDENCPLENEYEKRNEPYTYSKLKQEQIVEEYSHRHGITYVTIRPGNVFGPGKPELTGRIGIDTFGFFLHLGGKNRIPFTYVDNCAEAIILAGLTPGLEGQVLNVVDDKIPKSREFLRMYRKNVHWFCSVSIPYTVFHFFCRLWEWYFWWSKGQLPLVFNVRRCAAYWKGNRYSNEKLKQLTGWYPKISFREGATRYFESLRGSSYK